MIKQWLGALAVATALVTSVGAVMAQETEMPEPVGIGSFDAAPLDVALSPDGSTAYLVHADGTLGVYAVGIEGGLLPLNESVAAGGISYQPVALALSPDGTTLYVANSGFIGRSLLSPVTVWAVGADGTLTQTARWSLPSSGSGLTSIAVSADGSALIVGGAFENTAAVFPLEASSQVVTMLVAPYKLPCSGVGPMLCLSVAQDGGPEQFFYSAIEGFTFQWGHPVTLRVQVEEIANPPADGSSLRYTVVEVVNDDGYAAGTSFDATVPGLLISVTDDGAFSLNGDVAFTCADAATCDAVNAVIGTPDTVALTFTFPDVEGEPLVAQAG